HPRLLIQSMRVDAYIDALSARLGAIFGPRRTGVYVIGSLALGGFVEGRSDIDVMAIVKEAPGREEKTLVVEALSHPHLECPSRGLEFVLYEEEAVRVPNPGAAFEINLNTGPAMTFACSFDPATEPAHWFVLDRAIARSNGITVVGPPAREIVAALPRKWLLQALLASLEWHVAHEASEANTVLNAARAWRFAAEDAWSSKVDAAAWAGTKDVDPGPLKAALAARAGHRSAALDPTATGVFVARVKDEITAALGEA
ncbi:MAG: DUF4111 domain-containing protein, partial [Actinomycetota bacterium]|nr:DUF4111 domain-containing protein [Actinomycetota bacterium]